MQYKAALWILITFCTSLTSEIETLVGLIPTHFYFKKLVKQYCLKTTTLLSQHKLIFLLSVRNSKSTCSHLQLLVLLNNAQYTCLKGLLLDTEALLFNFTECQSYKH